MSRQRCRRYGEDRRQGCARDCAAHPHFETPVRELVANHPMLQQMTGSMFLARATLQREHNALHPTLSTASSEGHLLNWCCVCWEQQKDGQFNGIAIQ
jgi:hypothetical protein